MATLRSLVVEFFRTLRYALKEGRSLLVVIAGLVSLAAIASAALATLPKEDLGQNVVTLATSAFGIVGTVVGAYFAVNASGNARDAAKEMALAVTRAEPPPAAPAAGGSSMAELEPSVDGERP